MITSEELDVLRQIRSKTGGIIGYATLRLKEGNTEAIVRSLEKKGYLTDVGYDYHHPLIHMRLTQAGDACLGMYRR